MQEVANKYYVLIRTSTLTFSQYLRTLSASLRSKIFLILFLKIWPFHHVLQIGPGFESDTVEFLSRKRYFFSSFPLSILSYICYCSNFLLDAFQQSIASIAVCVCISFEGKKLAQNRSDLVRHKSFTLSTASGIGNALFCVWVQIMHNTTTLSTFEF